MRALPVTSALRRRRIAVLQGGWSAERDISLKSGRAVSEALGRMKIQHRPLDLTPDLPRDLRRHRIDLAFLVTHGSIGEDGRLQGLLDVMKIPYTGSGVRASALAMHKPSAKELFRAVGLPVPRGVVRRTGDTNPRLPFPYPAVVKPAEQGSAVGVAIAPDPAALRAALRATWKLDAEALVEERLVGPEITVGVLDGEALPVVEIIPQHAFYDFHSKYAPGGSRHIVPARLPLRTAREAQRLAVEAHRALGCRHVSRVDMIVTRGAPKILEINTLPGLTDTSLLPDAARAAGLSFDALVVHLLRLALRDA